MNAPDVTTLARAEVHPAVHHRASGDRRDSPAPHGRRSRSRHDRGIHVRAVLDHTAQGQHYSGATYLANHGINVFTDGETVITGSFNFTRQAENSNAENLLVIKGKAKLAAAYAKNFEAHLEHSKKYEAPKGEH